MTEIVLNRPGVMAVVGQLVAAGMPQHVAVDQKREPCRLPGSGDHSLMIWAETPRGLTRLRPG